MNKHYLASNSQSLVATDIKINSRFPPNPAAATRKKSKPVIAESENPIMHWRPPPSEVDIMSHKSLGILGQYCASLNYLSDYNPVTTKKRAHELDEDSEEQTHIDHLPFYHSILHKPFDPFLVGGPTLTQRHLTLMHTYMQHIGPLTWGTLRGTADFGPNHVTHLCLRYSDAASLWTAILTEETIQAMSGQPRTQEMMVQRAEGRRALLLALRNRHQNLPNACLAITKATQAYVTFGSKETLAVLGTAADQLIESVGGLKQALLLTSDIEPYYIASMYMFSLYIFTTRAKLVESFLGFLHSIQQILRHDKPGHRRSFRGRVHDLLSEQAVPEGYLILETDIIQIFSPFTNSSPGSSTGLHRYRISLLLQLCPIFIDFEMDVIVDALQRIRYFFNSIANHGSIEHLILQGAPIAALAALVCHVRRSILSKYVPHKRLESEFRTTEATIAGWKVFHYLPERSQSAILSRLHAWFTHTPGQFEPFTDEDIETFTSEVVRSWYN